MNEYRIPFSQEDEGGLGWWLFAATDAQRARFPVAFRPDATTTGSLAAQYNAYHAPAPAPVPSGSVIVTPIAWASQTIAPAPMAVGNTYAFSFTPNTDPQGHSISVAEFQASPRMRRMRLATDPHGVNTLPNGLSYGISGIIIFGSESGQCVLAQGTTYYLVVDMVGIDGQPVGSIGDNATAVVTLR